MNFLFKLFGKTKIQELESLNESLHKRINQLETKIRAKEAMIVKTTTTPKEVSATDVKPVPVKESKPNVEYSKQWEVIEKNLRNLQLENQTLKDQLLQFEKIIPKEQLNHHFLVEIESFYSTNKFLQIKEKLIENNILFLQDIEKDIFSTLLKEEPNVKEALKKYLDYTNGIIEWDVRTTIFKGDRVNKIYQKNRKFLSFLHENNIEFMIDLENFDFDSLLNAGFKNKDIDVFKEKKELYFKERRV